MARGRGRRRGGGGRTTSNHFQVEDNADTENMRTDNNQRPNENQNDQQQETQNQNDNIVAEEQNANNGVDEVILGADQIVNGRKVLVLEGDMFFRADKVARVITKITKTRIDPAGSSWKKMTDETKEFYFEEFRKAYHWEEGMEVRVKEAWHTKASKRYSDILS